MSMHLEIPSRPKRNAISVYLQFSTFVIFGIEYQEDSSLLWQIQNALFNLLATCFTICLQIYLRLDFRPEDGSEILLRKIQDVITREAAI